MNALDGKHDDLENKTALADVSGDSPPSYDHKAREN